MQQFRHITTGYTPCWPGHKHSPACQWGAKFPVEATEWVRTGLAIQHLNHTYLLQEDYGILHVASGRLLTGSTAPTLIEAALWLQLIKDVTDWTQPGEILQANEEPQALVHAMREQAFLRYNQMSGKKIVDWDYAESHNSNSIGYEVVGH
jgi:hypothetical protein